MENEMIFTSESGKEIKCNVVATFDINGIKYIAYTDGTMIDGEEELYVSKYTLDEGSMHLEEITSDYEWKIVDKYLDDYIFSEDEDI